MADDQTGSKRAMLRDVERLESQVAELRKEVAGLVAICDEAISAANRNPFSNVTPEDLMFLVTGAVHAAGSLQGVPKLIHGRGKAMVEAFKVWRGEIEAPWEVEQARKRAERDAQRAEMEGVERITVPRSDERYEFSGITPPPLIPSDRGE